MIPPRSIYGLVSDNSKAQKIADENPNRKLLLVQLVSGPSFMVNFDGSANGLIQSGLYGWVKFEPKIDGIYSPVFLAPQATACTVNVLEV